MPYEITIKKPVTVDDDSIYTNECCWGGDVIRNELFPLISARYEHVRTEQEDWGWFIWFRKGDESLAVDIFCDEPKEGLFRIRLTSRTKRFLFSSTETDTPELEELLRLITSHLKNSATSVEFGRVP